MTMQHTGFCFYLLCCTISCSAVLLASQYNLAYWYNESKLPIHSRFTCSDRASGSKPREGGGSMDSAYKQEKKTKNKHYTIAARVLYKEEHKKNHKINKYC